ncbi:MAG: glycolate oxidase subunit GlcF [Arenicella sp.]
MQTSLSDFFKNTSDGQQSGDILRSCVHCGFCLATCPTYNELGNELDSPRGRIYLIKQLLEGHAVTEKTQTHLDRCLTCRNCETTCPSGVQYGQLIDVGRRLVDEQVSRSFWDRAQRFVLRQLMSNERVFTPMMKVGQSIRFLLPQSLKKYVPIRQKSGVLPKTQHKRKMLILEGCVQPSMSPQINAATRRVLDELHVEVISVAKAGCCGAVNFHLSAHEQAKQMMRRNIDAWWPLIEGENGQPQVEAIIMTASGCGSMVADYAHQLADDPDYAAKAKRVCELSQDIATILAREDLSCFQQDHYQGKRIAFHPPCSLQHAQKVTGVVETILMKLGFSMTDIPDKHVCCGSAGTYSITQKKLSQTFLNNKVAALESDQPDLIASANIGCLLHIQSGTQVPVKHWIELLDKQ